MKEFELPRFEVVHRSDDLDRARFFEVGQYGAATMDVGDSQLDILSGHRVHKAIVLGGPVALILGGLHGGAYLGEQAREISKPYVVDCALDRPARRMPHHENDLGTRYLAREFHASKDVVVGDVSRHARIEAIADA